MAKRVRPARQAPQANEGPDGRIGGGPEGAAEGGAESPGGRKAEDVLGGFAEELGRVLGTVQNRATSWLDQRKAISEQLTQIRDTANQYLQQLSGESPFPWNRQGGQQKRRGRPPASAAAPAAATRGAGRPAGAAAGKRTMSAEARARIAEAQRKRWAKQRREKAGS